MTLTVQFHSYFKELAGVSQSTFDIIEGSKLGDLLNQVHERFPKLKPLERSTLTAVGVEYQRPDYILKAGDEISLFPPVQGG